MNQYTRKGYIVQEKDEEYGIAVVATSSSEAKTLGFNSGDINCDWVDVRVRWRKEANVMDLPVGIIQDIMLALRRGVYSWIEEGDCDICHNACHVNYHPPRPSNDNDYAVRYRGMAICGDCEDKIT